MQNIKFGGQSALLKDMILGKTGDEPEFRAQAIWSAAWEGKVEQILKGSLDLIPSPSLSVKIRIMGGKVCLRCKGKTLLGVVNKLLKTKCLLTSPSNVLPYYFK